MKYFKVGFSLLMCISLIFGFINYELSAMTQPVKAAADITTSNYSTWTAETLSEANQSVKNLLTSSKGSDSSRPYKDNATWSEGSLSALDKVYTVSSAVSTTDDVSANLSREQLIQTVRGLELAGTKNKASYVSLNNYPDDSGKYSLEYEISNMGLEAGEKIDVMFILDWSGSMKRQSVAPTAESSLVNGRKMVEAFSQKLIESNADARIRLIAHNQANNNTFDSELLPGYIPRNGIQKDSGFFQIDDNKQYLQTIQNMYTMDPQYENDSIPWVIKAVTDLVKKEGEGKVRSDATPVMIVLSDFQLNIGGTSQYAVLKQYEDSLKAYNTGFSGKVPAFIAAAYYNAYHVPGMGGSGVIGGITDVQEATIKGINSDWSAVRINESNYTTAEARLKDAIDTGVGYLPWNANLKTNAFKFTEYNSTENEFVSLDAKNLAFKGLGDGEGIFNMNVDTAQYSNPKKGDMAQATTTATASTDKESVNFSPTSKLFLPITDAAVELYKYNGSGSQTSASNYSLADTVVSNNYNAYSGTSYSKQSSILTSIDYLDTTKKKLVKQDALNALKQGLGETEFNKLDFTQSGSLNADSLTVQFDSSKNVYKIYAESKVTDSTITIEHWIKDGAKIATSTQADIQKTGAIGDLANITPTEISGYTYVNSDSDPLSSVTFGNTNKTVKLYYSENTKTSTMKVKYINKVTGLPIISEKTIEGTIGESPTEEQLDKAVVGDNYTFVEQTPVNAVFGTHLEVTLYYTATGKVTIEYWNSDTNSKITSIADEVLQGESGSAVNYTQKQITGYEYDAARSDTVPTTFTDGNVTVRQYYYKVYTVTIEYWDSGTNSKISTETNTIITGKKDAALNYSPKELDGYIYDSIKSDNIPTTITGDATYRAYYNKAGSVTIEYWSSDTNQKIAGQPDEVLKGILDTKAEITPKEISGYKFDASRSDSLENITYKVGSNTVRLYYTQYVDLTIIFEKISPKEELGKVTVKAKIGDTVHLENNFSEVKTKLAELESSYRLYERPDNYAAYKVPNDDASVTYLFDGTLFLSSAPSLLEFGSNHTIMQLGEYESERPAYDKPLTVTDTRANLSNWTISVKLTEDMHSRKKPTFILKDSLYYRDGDKLSAVTSDSPLDIITSKHSENGNYDVSKAEWENKSNGFIFKLSQKQYREIDDYDGTIQFTLTEAK
ncbi:MucBP domain-containing protein [Candidatus Enterococcus mansonii]|nr:MucBP domain-containing protein [Enterococcus sp. 4G2_DIV0659]